jgi:hypothetical protein
MVSIQRILHPQLNRKDHPHGTKATESLIFGLMSGMIAANTMTMLRMIARRFGWIDKTVPQAMEGWLLNRMGIDLPGDISHHMLDQVLHLGYAAGLGALDGYLYHRRFERTYVRGVLIGMGTWAFGSFVIFPLLEAGKTPMQSNTRENATNIIAHLLFGLGTALLTEELTLQEERAPARRIERKLARVG